MVARHSGQVGGSPPYMAPEQARGQWERIDARTDVYGLGAVLYYLLTGKPPHDGKTPIEVLEQARDASGRPAPRKKPPRPAGPGADLPEGHGGRSPVAIPVGRRALRQALRRYRLTRRAAPVLGAVAVVLALLVHGLGVLARHRLEPSVRRAGRRDRRSAGPRIRSAVEQTPPGRPAGDPLRDPPFPQA